MAYLHQISHSDSSIRVICKGVTNLELYIHKKLPINSFPPSPSPNRKELPLSTTASHPTTIALAMCVSVVKSVTLGRG